MKMLNLLQKSLETINTLASQGKIDYLITQLTEVLKCQGAYTSIIDYDDDLGEICGLRCVSLVYNKKYGNSEEIYVHDPPIGVYFPMESEKMLHVRAIKCKNILICNDSSFLKDHQCPGVKMYNIMYYPHYRESKLIALSCFINRKGGFSQTVIDYCKDLFNILTHVLWQQITQAGYEKNIKSTVTKSLKTEQDLSYYIINNSREIAIAIDDHYRITSISGAAQNQLKQLFDAQSIVIDDDLTKSLKGNPEISDKLITYFREALIGQTKVLVMELSRFGGMTGSLYWDCFFSPIENNGEIVGAFLLAKNVSQLVNLQKELENAKKEAVRANQMKDEYLSRISHELRTPLNSIIGFAQLIFNGGDELRNNVKHILHGGNHLLKLINEVLDLSAIETGNLKLSIERINLSLAIRESIQLMSSLANANRVTISCQVENTYVYGDYHRIQQILINVLSNAVKYNKQDGQISISVEKCQEKIIGTEKQPDDYVMIEISDTGFGIDQKYMDRLFTPFDRLAIMGDAIEGTGLGLVLSKSLIEKMDGFIKISSQVNVGTTVCLILPKVDCLEEDVSSNIFSTPPKADLESDQESLDKSSAKKAFPKILYIEDNPSNYQLMESIVKNYLGYGLISANLGSRGYELAMSNRPDLILLDLGLPDISGEELLVEFKASEHTKDIPIIVNSAYANESKISKAKSLGANEYITKPFNINKLIQSIKKYLK